MVKDTTDLDLWNKKKESFESERNPLRAATVPELILEFKVGGMTCVACSRTIEGAMEREFKQKGLISVQIALLTHKMRMVFYLNDYKLNKLCPQSIMEEVEMVGFSAELLEIIENNPEELLRLENMSQESNADIMQIGEEKDD
jgi:cation transport ATPase